MTEWSWDILNSKEFRWCKIHQIERHIHFWTAPVAVCPECDKEFKAELDAKMDTPSDRAPQV